MCDKINKIHDLIVRHVRDQLDEPERAELNAWIGESNENKKVFDGLVNEDSVAKKLQERYGIKKNESAIWKRIAEKVLPGARVVRMLLWVKVSIAASVILLLVMAGLVKVHLSHKLENRVAVQNPGGMPGSIIDHGHDGAILKLADNSVIVLDKAANGILARQGNSRISKKDNGQLVYEAGTNIPHQPLLYNTLETLRGRKFRLVLPDSSNVWLNAASSIKYPTAFTGNTREVEIKGEVYFEVAKNRLKPFIVKIQSQLSGNLPPVEIEVVGTHFNINAYADEPVINTSLLEGAVRIKKGSSVALLSPGQQAQVSLSPVVNKNSIRVITDADMDLSLAWKNGYTAFKKADLPAIMRQVSRWYNLEVVFEGPVPAGTFSGKVSRNASLDKLLKVFEAAGIHFSITGNRLIVRQ